MRMNDRDDDANGPAYDHHVHDDLYVSMAMRMNGPASDHVHDDLDVEILYIS
jgi:hypothetical protein